MSEQITTGKLNKRYLAIGSVVVIVILVFAFDPFGLRSILQPDAPEQGIGYGYTRFYDPFRNEYYNGTYDLVKVSNTTEYYMRGVASDEIVNTEEECYIIFNGTSVEINDGYSYFPFSLGFEASQKESEPQENVIFLKRIAKQSETNASIYWKDGSYGTFVSGDISNLVNVEFKLQISNSNTSNYIGQFVWLPQMMISQSAADVNASGWGFWLALIGTSEPPISTETALVDGRERPVTNLNNKVSVLYLTVEHASSYSQTIALNNTKTIIQSVVYYGEITDWENTSRIIEVM